MMFNCSYFDKSILNDYSPMSPKMFLGPGVGQRLSNGAHSDGVHPNGAHPNGAHPNSAYPNGAHPNGAHPNSTQPNGAQPNGAHPKSAHPINAHPNGALPIVIQGEPGILFYKQGTRADLHILGRNLSITHGRTKISIF